jgi:hypothetical protein
MAGFFSVISLLLKLFKLGERLNIALGEKRLEDWIAEVDDAVKGIEESKDDIEARAAHARKLLELTKL